MNNKKLRKFSKNLMTVGAITFGAINSYGGREVGNGGDYIRGTFLRIGGNVLKYLEEHPVGQKIVEENSLHLEVLKYQLTTDIISVTSESLRDNTGSRVDAIGVPGKIQLSDTAWSEHFEYNRDIYYLVFHELLRSAAVDDDDFRLSRQINPFPSAFRFSTKLVNAASPLVNEDLSKIIRVSDVGFAGEGCPSAGLGTVVEFDPVRGTLELALRKFTLKTSQVEIDRKACSIAAPFRLGPRQRLVLSQMDIQLALQLQPGTEFTARAEAFLAGQTGPVLKKVYKGDSPSKVNGQSVMRETQLVRTKCGESSNLRINTSGLLQQMTGRERTEHSLVDVNRIALYMKIENCN